MNPAEHHQHYIRETYEHDEPVWEKDFKTNPVHLRQYLLACMRYIELNPVNPGLAGYGGARREFKRCGASINSDAKLNR